MSRTKEESAMLDTDEIKAKLEELYDAVQVRIKETEGADEEPLWQQIALNILDAIAVLDFILLLRSQERELAPDPNLLIFVEREQK